MKHLSIWKPVAIGVCISGAFFAACSSGSSDNGGGSGSGSGSGSSGGGSGSSSGSSSGGGGDDGGPCVLQVEFAPSYSAYESSHTYQIPFIVTNGAMTGTNAVTWMSSDSTNVTLAAATDQLGDNLEMATIAGQPSGPVTITATDPTGACASSTSTLTITATTAELWEEGYERYTSGEVLTRPEAGAGGFEGGIPEGGFHFDAAGVDSGGLECTNCHAVPGQPPNPAAPYKDVQHTPEQTGGFSDTDLINIFTNGQIPDGGYFDPSVICGDASTCTFESAYARWSNFHHWTMPTDEVQGMVTYLRSLTPAGQTGSSNFGGHGHHDGGGGGSSSGGGSGSSSGGSADASGE